jgi:orotidine-5'-phosphate decarboxylase
MSNPLYVAIDTPYLDDALDLARRVKAHIGGVKLGLEFFCANGHHGVHEVQKLGLPIFLDLKLHDIPNTVAKAMQAINALEPAIVTIHAAGGRAMMEDAKAAAGAHTKVVAVTVLTSLDDHDQEKLERRLLRRPRPAPCRRQQRRPETHSDAQASPR